MRWAFPGSCLDDSCHESGSCEEQTRQAQERRSVRVIWLALTGLRKPGQSKGLTQQGGTRGSRKAGTPEASSALRCRLSVRCSWCSWASRPHFPHSEFLVQRRGVRCGRSQRRELPSISHFFFQKKCKNRTAALELRSRPGLDGSSICLVPPIGLPRCPPLGSVSRGPDDSP